ncbi:MAG: 4Fe-4S dicluster domain-containing protein [Promethearchaeota archaeon]
MNIDKQLQEIAENLAKCVKDAISCFQCGTCVAACPVSRITGGDSYHPRRFVWKTLEGQAHTLLEDSILWLCTSCHACLEHCPQKVPVSELIQDLQNLASEIGCAPADIVAEVDNILATGWALPPSESVNKRREQMGLPPVPIANRNSRDLQAIAKATKLNKRIKQVKARREAEAAKAEGGEKAE